jgi:hypothetical protein
MIKESLMRALEDLERNMDRHFNDLPDLVSTDYTDEFSMGYAMELRQLEFPKHRVVVRRIIDVDKNGRECTVFKDGEMVPNPIAEDYPDDQETIEEISSDNDVTGSNMNGQVPDVYPN